MKKPESWIEVDHFFSDLHNFVDTLSGLGKILSYGDSAKTLDHLTNVQNYLTIIKAFKLFGTVAIIMVCHQVSSKNWIQNWINGLDVLKKKSFAKSDGQFKS